MVFVLPNRDVGASIGRAIGEGATSAYMHRADEKALQKIVSGLKPDASPRDILNAITGASTYNDESKHKALKNFFTARELEEKERVSKNTETKLGLAETEKKAKDQRGIDEKKSKRDLEINGNMELLKKMHPDVEEKDLRETALKLPANVVRDQYKEFNKPEKAPTQTVGQKAIEKKRVESYINATEELPKLRDNLKNLDRMREISRRNAGPLGYLKTAINRKDAGELEALGATLSAPFIKVFNPSGAVAQAKLKWIQSIFSINPWDLQSTIEGKINASEAFTKQAIARNEEKIALFEKYDGNPPEDEVKKFDKETQSMLDAVIDMKPEDFVNSDQSQKVRVKNKKTGAIGKVTITDQNRDMYDIIE